MAQIKLKGRITSLYKIRTVLGISFIVTFLLMNKYIRVFQYSSTYVSNFVAFFANPSLITVYGSLIGLLLASYSVLITMIPNFHADSLKQPIFGQVNRLYVFTIMDGILLMIIDFTNGVIPYYNIEFFLDIEIFFFFSLLMGLVFCVLSLSDLFSIVRKRGER
ncbi:MAG: hypothetical protein B2I17_02445 [Thermoplasmatales archaeon B_DKE]|nr:MAG: hypothetical protein B2I17_02445 [Thermoplasmatales archaeon B_DKE]QRF75532.1 hypothetical protein Thermo_01035 [Thermoplasmatales archaeon]